MRKLGVPPENLDPLRYNGPRLNLTPVTEANRRPAVYDRDYPLNTYWRTKAPTADGSDEGELWYLSRFDSNGDAIWLMLSSGGSGPLINIQTDDGPPNVVPNGMGTVQVLGGSGIAVTGQGPGNTVTVSTTGSVASQYTTDAGIAVPVGDNLNVLGGTGISTTGVGDTVTINWDGSVALVDEIGVQFNTPPGTNPVVPNAGRIDIDGNVVANGTNLNEPVATHSRTANTFDIDVQQSGTADLGSSSVNDVGLSSYVNEHFDLDVNAQVYIADRLRAAPIGTTLNIGVTYANPTFTVHGYDGTALSTSNPGWVVLPDRNNAGRRVIIKVTANQSFQDRNGTGDMNGNLFGTTTAIAWAPTLGLPMYIYAVANDAQDTIAFCLSRVPHRTGAPAAANIAKSGSAVASTQGSFFMIDSSFTVADFDLNPSFAIGSLRMNKDSSDNWAVEASSGAAIGFFQETIFFEMPQSQNGAAVGNWWSKAQAADTLPTWPGTTGVNYRIQKDGYQYFAFSSQGPSVSGAGTAGAIRLHLPLNWAYNNVFHCPPSNMSWVSGGTFTTLLARESTASTTLSYLEWVKTGAGTTLLSPGDLTTSQDNIGIWANVTISTV